jgi:hypothetical protein
MNTRKLAFRFNSLVIDLNMISKVLGYADAPLPPPFDVYLQEALQLSGKLDDILATYKVFKDIRVDAKKQTLVVSGQEFHIGKIVCNELKGSDSIAVFVCTAGKIISETAERLLKGDDPVKGYVYNVLGNAIAESVGNAMQSILREEVNEQGLRITNRYSPGYCGWSVADQHKLFALFEESPCGVTLRPSALMQPVKSISGVIGIGKDVRYREYQCSLCPMTQCINRRTATR